MRRAQRALCVRCGALLARPALFGRDAGLAFALAGLILLLPALWLPFATVSRVGPPRATTVLDGAWALWEHGMPFLAGWVALCGAAFPALLLLVLCGAWWAVRRRTRGPGARALLAASHALQAWAMPEVLVLAVLVAFVRIDAVADVSLESGFWCYAALSVALVIAWRSLLLEPHTHTLDASPVDVAN